ncbi:MAG TPA: Ig-like domain-containing protein, partial [Candidatus Acidoferrum sp.]|nr:Ig-like domain-containing protein [Candidatus Acidoferrum sp.]
MLVVVLTGIGAFLFYENTLPTTLTTNFKSGQKDVPTDSRVLLTFSRPVGLAAVEAAFSISPAADGSITSLDGQTRYAWSPSKGLTDLTTYTVTMKSIVDMGRHRVPGRTWTFTTLIVPHVTSITGAAGTPLTDGTEID